jgi:hypothetical protein
MFQNIVKVIRRLINCGGTLMEYFDILNRDGSNSGKIALKGELMSNDQYYLGVHAYIHNSKGEFIMR